ncbi:MAG: Proline iminopeptidase [Bacteroidota bacterium]
MEIDFFQNNIRGFILGMAFTFGFSACNSPVDDQKTAQLSADYWNYPDSSLRNTGGIRMIPVQTPNGTVKVWTKRIGNNPEIKVLLIHGGPGGTHELFECFDGYLPAAGIEYIYYDQSGTYYSDPLPDSSLWTIDHYVKEIEQVRKALGLDSTNFFLLGQSAGGIFAMEYALRYQQHLKGLIVSDMMASVPDYNLYAQQVLGPAMPAKVWQEIKQLEAKADLTNPRYEELLFEHYYTQHLLRKPISDWPESVQRAFKHLTGTIYVHMQGHSELGITGNATLKNWDIKERIKEIRVPSLFVCGSHDTMDPEQMRWMSEEVEQGNFLLCPNSGHIVQYDAPEVFFPGIISFLRNVN